MGGETEEWLRYGYYLHYAEGSLMPYLVFALVVSRKLPLSSHPCLFFFFTLTPLFSLSSFLLSLFSAFARCPWDHRFLIRGTIEREKEKKPQEEETMVFEQKKKGNRERGA